MTKKRIGVVLCGSGQRDGSEIHEATLTLLAIDRAGAEALCFAPMGAQQRVCDHITGKETGERRDMMAEAARIARGRIRDLALAHATDLDAVVIPGGQGAAINLSTFIAEGANCTVHPELARLVKEMVAAGKPVGALCIACATLAKALERAGISATITVGTKAEIVEKIEAMGHRHESCPATDCVVDRERKIVTTPAYLNAQSIGELWVGVEKLVAALMSF